VTVTDAAVQQYSVLTLVRRPRKAATGATARTTDGGGCDRTPVLMTSSILDDEDEDVQNANTPDELTSSSSVIRLPQLHQRQHQQQQRAFDCAQQIGTVMIIAGYCQVQNFTCPLTTKKVSKYNSELKALGQVANRAKLEEASTHKSAKPTPRDFWPQ